MITDCLHYAVIISFWMMSKHEKSENQFVLFDRNSFWWHIFDHLTEDDATHISGLTGSQGRREGGLRGHVPLQNCTVWIFSFNSMEFVTLNHFLAYFPGFWELCPQTLPGAQSLYGPRWWWNPLFCHPPKQIPAYAPAGSTSLAKWIASSPVHKRDVLPRRTDTSVVCDELLH